MNDFEVQTRYTTTSIPPEYKPISAWGYFGLSLLYSIPLIGFIMLIVHAFSRSNVNRRNYARSYFCGYIIVAVIVVIYFIVAFAILGMSFGDISGAFENMFNGIY